MTREELLKIAKPILFNTEMVQAILDGRKTATRRAIKDIPKEAHMWIDVDTEKREAIFLCGNCGKGMAYDYEENIKMPYMEGDYLYVRETWKQATTDYAGGGYDLKDLYLYKADKDIDTVGMIAEDKWHPSIHMLKTAARIFLRVTDVRVERLQDITDNQAIDEGCKGIFANVDWVSTPREEYVDVWNSTVKKSDLAKYGWDANPWVWVVSFEILEVE